MRLANFLIGYGLWLGVWSMVTLAVYAWDKRQAKRGGRSRVSEKKLHGLELLGGWPGAWLGQRWLRHKSVKRSYRVVFVLMVVLHGAVVGGGLAWIGYFYFGWMQS